MWKKLKLDNNELVSDNLKPDLFILIQEFSDMFADEHVKVGNTSWVEFKIDLKEPGASFTPPPLKKDFKGQLDEWLRDCVIEPADSLWASQLVPVKKKIVQYVGLVIFAF